MNTPKKIEAWQIKTMHTLLRKLNLMAWKQDIMNADLPDDRYVTSSKDLYYEEANRIIKYLQGQQNQSPEEVSLDRQRKKIISSCREMGWNKGGYADMRRIYDWVEKYGYLNKPLNEYTLQEIPRLVTQASNMKDSYLKGFAK